MDDVVQVEPLEYMVETNFPVGMAMFLMSFAVLLLFTPTFEELRAGEVVAPMPVPDAKGKLWFWGSLAVGAIFATVIYLSVVSIGHRTTVFLQPQSFGIALWSLCCGLFTILSMFIYYKTYGKAHGIDLADRGVKMPVKKLLKSVLLAVIVAGVTYTWVFVADYFFKTDFRLWTLAVKTFEADKIGVALWPYLWMFLVFYIASSVSVNAYAFEGTVTKYGDTVIAVGEDGAPSWSAPSTDRPAAHEFHARITQNIGHGVFAARLGVEFADALLVRKDQFRAEGRIALRARKGVFFQ